VHRSGVRAVLGVALIAAASAVVAGDEPCDVPVAVRVGMARVRLDVRLHFADAARGLPPPGELPVSDAHDLGHGARTYCYQYPTKAGAILLELYDSDFGLHTARLSRLDGSSQQRCPVLSHEPRVQLGNVGFGLASLPMPQPAGFQIKKTEQSVIISRSWTYSEPAKAGALGSCFSREISVTIEPAEGMARSLMVQNWEEPGC
jgi:hypothetical protein